MTNELMTQDNWLSTSEFNLQERFTSSLTESTKRAYISDIKEFFNVISINQITPEQLSAIDTNTANKYFEHLTNKGLKIATVNRKMTSLSYFFTFLSRRDIKIVDYNPFSPKEGSRRFKNSKNYSSTRCLTVDEVKKLISVTNEDTTINLRDKLIIMLLVTTGMRREEITTIKIGDVFKNNGKWCAEIIGKGDKARYIIFAPMVYDLMVRYITERGSSMEHKDEYLLINHSRNYDTQGLSTITVYSVIKKYSAYAGIDPETVSPHSLRHSFITISLESGAKLEDVQDMVGHSDMSTTRRYDHTNRVIKNNTSEKLSNMFI